MSLLFVADDGGGTRCGGILHDYQLPTTKSDPAVTRERVTGIGGVFFRAKDPENLSAWYDDTFGVSRAPRDYSTAPWMQQAGATVFAPFPSDTDYFGNPSQAWMLNFRVANLDRMIAQLRARGIDVVLDPEIYPNGRFARSSDPEGNPIELWEPKVDS